MSKQHQKQCKDSSEDLGTGSESFPTTSVTMDRPILEPSKVKGIKGEKETKGNSSEGRCFWVNI